jgi:hypothetical protein
MNAFVQVLATVYDDGNGKGSSYGNGVGFVIIEPYLIYDCDHTYEYGSVPVSTLDLDSGYNWTVVFETRWYGTGNSYSD